MTKDLSVNLHSSVSIINFSHKKSSPLNLLQMLQPKMFLSNESFHDLKQILYENNDRIMVGDKFHNIFFF